MASFKLSNWLGTPTEKPAEVQEASSLVDPVSIPLPANATFFHISHWKAGSQWMKGLLEGAFPNQTVLPKPGAMQLIEQPIRKGVVYTSLFLSKWEFDTLALPENHYRFLLLRDLRDTLVSGYFSIRVSHTTANDRMKQWRHVLNGLNEEDGMIYLMEIWLNNSAFVHRSWLEANERFYRLEDFMTDPAGQMASVFSDAWKMNVPRAQVEALVTKYSFQKQSGGRKPGQEDKASHYRKGVAGDWKLHFTPRITKRFKTLFNDVLIMGGYERDSQW